jgi:hypothetical protein
MESSEDEKMEEEIINEKFSMKINTPKSTNASTSSLIRITASAAPTISSSTHLNDSASNKTTALLKSKLLAPSTSYQATPNPVATSASPTLLTCYICSKSAYDPRPISCSNLKDEKSMIKCSSCSRYTHPSCLELNPKLVSWKCIREYDWQCMECKKCSKCSNPHDEEKMMFCDRCDRGFHTYCVGVRQVPSGSWLCKACSNELASANSNSSDANHKTTESQVILNNIDNSFLKSILKKDLTPIKQHKSPTGSNANSETKPVARRGRPPGSLNKPKDPNSPKKTP